jgi:hypothetical protein
MYTHTNQRKVLPKLEKDRDSATQKGQEQQENPHVHLQKKENATLAKFSQVSIKMVEEIKDGASRLLDYAGQSILGAVIFAGVYIGIYSHRIDSNTQSLEKTEQKVEYLQNQISGIQVIQVKIEEIRRDQDELLQEIKSIKKTR